MKKATWSSKKSPTKFMSMLDEILAPRKESKVISVDMGETQTETKAEAIQCLQELELLARDIGEEKTKKAMSVVVQQLKTSLVMLKQVEETSERIELLEKQQEIRKARSKIVIKGLKSGDTKELSKEMKDVGYEPPIKYSKHFLAKSPGEKTKVKDPVTAVSSGEFDNEMDKKEFFRCLARGGLAKKGLHVGDYIPTCFAKDRLRLDTEAYNLRKEAPGTRTKLVLGFCGPFLLVREKGKSTYSKKV